MKPQVIIISVLLSLSVATSSAQPGQMQNSKPKCEATFAGKKSGTITKKEFLSDSVLRVVNEDTLTPNKYKVVSFNVSIIARGRNPILDVPSEGAKMPEGVRSLIKDLNAGDKIFIEGIRTGSYRMSEKNKNGVSIPHRVPVTGEAIAFTIADE